MDDFKSRSNLRDELSSSFKVLVFALWLTLGTTFGSTAFGAIVPFLFETNQGQAPQDVYFLARAGEVTHGVLDDGLRVVGPPSVAGGQPETLRLRLQDKSDGMAPQGIEPLRTRVNYYLGDAPEDWQTGIETFARVRFDEVYPGIAWELYGRAGDLEHDFIVAPGADPSAIRMAFDGVQPQLLADGSLRLGAFVQHPPVTYQTTAAGRRVIASRYVLDGGEVGFEVENYDVSLPLVIDPVLTYSTYLGGEGIDVGWGIDVDGAGFAYVTGTVGNPLFELDEPLTPNTDHAGGGSNDGFVAKIDPEGEEVVYLTFFGGSEEDLAQAVTVNPAGEAWVGGSTQSDDFPVLVGGAQTSAEGLGDAFVARFDVDGALMVGTYLGGSDEEAVMRNGIARDADGDLYLVGWTVSEDFPTVDPFQTDLATEAPNSDAFIAKLSEDLSTVIYASYFGGERSECRAGCAVAVDETEAVYLAGSTQSDDLMPINAFQDVYAGGEDVFLAVVSPLGDQLTYTSYFGGSGSDHLGGIALDSAGRVHLAGQTFSNDLPVSADAHQGNSAGSWDAYLVRFDLTLPPVDQRVYGTYLGGSGQDRGWDVAVDGGDNSHLVGYTGSPDFPTAEPLKAMADRDAFVARFDPGGALAFSTPFGGSDGENGYGVAVNTVGSVWITGRTESVDLPLAPDAPIQSSYVGGIDAYVARLTPDVVANPRFEYTAKVLCGVQGDVNDTRLAMGGYSTVVNIHNPNRETVEFHKKLALAYPPGGQQPGEILPIAIDRLAYDEALAVDCPDLVDRLFSEGFPAGTDGVPVTYIDGFVVIQSNHSLDVTTVYTTAGLDAGGQPVHHSSIDIEQISERENPPGADLEIRKRAELRQLDTITYQVSYTLEVENHGPVDAPNVVVTDLLEAELGSLVNLSNLMVSHGGVWAPGPLTPASVALEGTIPLLPAGDIAVLEFTVNATMDVAALALRLVDTGYVTADPGDPDLSNNDVELVTTIP